MTKNDHRETQTDKETQNDQKSLKKTHNDNRKTQNDSVRHIIIIERYKMMRDTK